MVSVPPIARKTRRKTIQKWPNPGPYQCHPSIPFRRDTGCFPAEDLNKAIATLHIAPTKNKLEALAKHLGIDSKHQRTFLNALPLPQKQKDILAKRLRPAYPEAWKEKPKEWLDSNDIRYVMKQYEEAHPEFVFLGPFPIDFASPDPYEKDKTKCLIEEMCKLNLDKEEIKGKKYIGIVFNLDRHDRDGSHWVAAFIDIVKNKCYYFDSYGMRPPNQVYRFMQWLTIQEPTMELARNGLRVQRSKSECGMFCMYFIVSMLYGMDYQPFCVGRPPDSLMFKMRTWMYST
jgi:hypothetical protein